MLDALEIGYVVKERRIELGMTQERLAAAAGVSKRCLWTMETGLGTGVRLDKLAAVLRVLGLELSLEASTGLESAAADPPIEAPRVEGVAPVDDVLEILTGGAGDGRA
mgnify:CR=1 FL=1